MLLEIVKGQVGGMAYILERTHHTNARLYLCGMASQTRELILFIDGNLLEGHGRLLASFASMAAILSKLSFRRAKTSRKPRSAGHLV